MNAKEHAIAIYNKHIALASSDGRSFRKTVMDELMSEIGCTLAAAATHYNHAKKLAPVDGLGRAPVPKGARKMVTTSPKNPEEQPDNECYTVIETVVNLDGKQIVGATQSFALQGDASEEFDSKVKFWPFSIWTMIRGMGPNAGDTFKMQDDEEIIKKHIGKQARTVKPEVVEAIEETDELAA